MRNNLRNLHLYMHTHIYSGMHKIKNFKNLINTNININVQF